MKHLLCSRIPVHNLPEQLGSASDGVPSLKSIVRCSVRS